MIDILRFFITDNESFVMHTDDADDVIHCCYQSQVLLHIEDKEIIIGKSIIKDFAERLKKKLALALENALPLHPSIQKNIGYYWNQDLNESEPQLFCDTTWESPGWVGFYHLLWTTDSRKKYEQYGTWLYNDAQGNIIFEVTQVYPETFIDPEDPADVAAYEAWMEHDYKTFYMRIIPKGLAFIWMNQAEEILQLITDNVAMLKEQEKNLKLDA